MQASPYECRFAHAAGGTLVFNKEMMAARQFAVFPESFLLTPLWAESQSRVGAETTAILPCPHSDTLLLSLCEEKRKHID